MTLKRFGAYLFLAATATTASACASSGAPASTTAATGSASVRRDPNVITRAELADPTVSLLSVYDAIMSLRPNFFASRGSHGLVGGETGQAHTTIDGSIVQSLDELKRLHVAGVVEIRFLDAAAAMQRFGGKAMEGPVIVVRTF